ncbi:MAG: TasA family protein [Lachnospiraceae bacterium]
MTKRKKITAGILATALIGTLVIGGTLAYFSQKTEEKTNTFTMGNGITGKLTEPQWDQKGKTLAENFTPGLEIPKDPQITNTTAGDKVSDAWVAVKISYPKDVKNFVDLDKFADVNWNTIDWTFGKTANGITDYTVAYYNVVLPKQQTSAPVFSKVTIDPLALTADQIRDKQYDASKYTGKTVTDYTMNNFDIHLQGYLVQKTGFANAQEAMEKAFPAEFKQS